VAFCFEPQLLNATLISFRDTFFLILKAGMKWIFALSCGAVITGFYKRFRWAPLKTRSITYIN
jgi:hypothetical protein